MTKTKTRSVKRMTAAEFVRDYGEARGVELIDGKLTRLPMPGINHGEIALRVGAMILNHVVMHKLGRCAGNDSFIRVGRNPDSYRGADVCFIIYEKLPKNKPSPVGPLEFAPDLVVEVRSPSDRHKAVRKKIEDYLGAGVKVVMVIDPETESVGVFRDDELPIRFHNGDKVVIPELMPKFQVPVKAFFE